MATALLGAPDADAFDTKVNEQITQLAGRILQGSGSTLRNRQMGRLAQLADQLDPSDIFASEEHDEQRGQDGSLEALAGVGRKSRYGSHAARVQESHAEHGAPDAKYHKETTEVDPAVRAQAQRTMGAAASEFDVMGAKEQWLDEQRSGVAKQQYELAQQFIKLATEQGKHEDAQKAQRRAFRIKREKQAQIEKLEKDWPEAIQNVDVGTRAGGALKKPGEEKAAKPAPKGEKKDPRGASTKPAKAPEAKKPTSGTPKPKAARKTDPGASGTEKKPRAKPAAKRDPKPAPKAEKKPAAPAKAAPKKHSAGFGYHDKELPFANDEKETKSGLPGKVIHALWPLLRDGNHKSLDHFSDDIMKQIMGEDYDKKTAVNTYLKPMLKELKRHGIVED
jgi:hypothetical protein